MIFELTKKPLYEFTIFGNQDSTNKNPIAYHRTTQGSYWNKRSRQYAGWKQYVRMSFKKAYPDIPINLNAKLQLEPILNSTYENQYFIYTLIYFNSKKHADPDNIHKGINDSLFDSDKFVSGAYEFEYSNKPCVLIKIWEVEKYLTKYKNDSNIT